MKEGFEHVFSDIQADMVSICLEYVEGRAETIFIYGSYESRVLSCDYFFKVAGNLYERQKLPEGYDVSVDRQKACMRILLDDMKKLISACAEYEAEMPTEIKLIYDVKNNKLNADYQYDEIYTNTEKTSDDIAEMWYQEILKKI